MLYSASDIFVLPTLAEQSPVVVKEAMAAGKPVVSTPVDGLPALVREGENGFLVDPRHVEPLALRLEELIADENLRRTIGENNRRRAVAEFGLPTMGEAWDQLLRSLGVEHDSKGHRSGRR
jgi:glycosyltransferase involved in cell wall biosynthesis